MDLDNYTSLILSGDLPGIAAVSIFLLLALWKKIKPNLWERIPKKWQWLIPAMLGFLSGFATALVAGKGWQGSALAGLVGLVEGFTAMGMHSGLKTSAAPYRESSGEKKPPSVMPAALVFCLIWLGACAAPCQLAMVLSAYEAEQRQCIQQNDTESKAVSCIGEVRKRYLSQFKELGHEIINQLREIENGTDIY